MFGRFYPIALLSLASCAPSQVASEPPELTAQMEWTNICKDWDDWDKPALPFRIYGNAYYVGTCGIAAILVTGDEGHVLIDGGTDAGAEVVARNIEALGFDLADVNILLMSHEHFDHVGGLAKLQRMTGARLLASPEAAPVMANGVAASDDPQAGMHDPFPAARVDGIVSNGEIVRLGDLALTAIATPGHTPGAQSWQWISCEEGDLCRHIVYADSLSPVSADAYRFLDHPGYLAAYRAGLDRLAALECAILLTPHPSASGMRERILTGGLNDPAACRAYAESIGKRLDARLAEEAGG